MSTKTNLAYDNSAQQTGQNQVVLIIDDDEDLRDSLRDIIEVEFPQFDIVTAANADQAVAIINTFNVVIALIDVKLGHSNGLDLIQPIKQKNEHTACIVMTAFRDAEYAVQAVQKGADEYLFKPIEPDKLFKTIGQFQKQIELEREKQEAERRFRAVFEQNFQMVFLIDGNRRIVDVNQTALTIMGENEQDVISSEINALAWWKNFATGKEIMARVVEQAKSGEIIQQELLALDPNNEYTHFSISVKPVSITPEEMLFVVECRDTTEQHQIEKMLRNANELLEERVQERTKDLEQAKEQAESANRAKTQFLSQISHELRTPLNAILGFSQILQMEDLGDSLSEQQSGFVNEINVAGKHLLQLIDALLDLTEIESGKFKISMEHVDLQSVLDQVAGESQPRALERHIAISRGSANANLTILADKKCLTKILQSIVSNAIEYNNVKGNVSIHVDTPATNNKVQIRIVDTGIGIPKNLHDRVFKLFDRLDRTSHVDGAGVNLALAKKLLELQNGRIGFESEEGQGSCFWIELDRASQQ